MYQIWKGWKLEAGLCYLGVAMGQSWRETGDTIVRLREGEGPASEDVAVPDHYLLSWSFKDEEAWLLHTSLHSLKYASHQNHPKIGSDI